METKEFMIDPKEISERLAERILSERGLSEIQKNILITLVNSDPFILAWTKKIIPVEDKTIALIFNSGKEKRVVIEYDELLDLYNVQIGEETIREVAGEELYPIIYRKIFLAES